MEVKRFRLPRRSDVWDVMREEPVARRVTEFEVPMTAGQTRICFYGAMPWLELGRGP